MAISTETFSKETVGDLEVLDIYNDLMEASTANGSIYIKAKETLESYLEKGALLDTEKSTVMANTIAGMASSMSASTMQLAYEIAKDRRNSPYELAKLREDTILVQEHQNKIATDIDNADEDIKTKVFNGWRLQGDLVRDYGINAFNLSTGTDIIPEAQYIEDGTKHEGVRQLKANVANTYSTMFRNNGYVAITTDTLGFLTNATSGDTNGLTSAQTDVAIRQEQGFDDNKRQHVANSAATMMSMLLSTEKSGIDYVPHLAKWTTAIDYLNTNHATTAGTIINDAVPASISIAVGVTLTGTTINITAGTSVIVQITDGIELSNEVVGITQLDGTWSVDFAAGDLTGLIPATGNITATLIDSTGATRTDIDTVTLVA